MWIYTFASTAFVLYCILVDLYIRMVRGEVVLKYTVIKL